MLKPVLVPLRRKTHDDIREPEGADVEGEMASIVGGTRSALQRERLPGGSPSRALLVVPAANRNVRHVEVGGEDSRPVIDVQIRVVEVPDCDFIRLRCLRSEKQRQDRTDEVERESPGKTAIPVYWHTRSPLMRFVDIKVPHWRKQENLFRDS